MHENKYVDIGECKESQRYLHKTKKWLKTLKPRPYCGVSGDVLNRTKPFLPHLFETIQAILEGETKIVLRYLIKYKALRFSIKHLSKKIKGNVSSIADLCDKLYQKGFIHKHPTGTYQYNTTDKRIIKRIKEEYGDVWAK